jgi:endonuclease VIII
MPEGDTIFRAARTLQKALGEQTITGFRTSLPKIREAEFAGRRITKVEARGKNLLIHFDDGRVLHTHMMMTGSWHIYRPGEKWQRPERQARIVLETEKFVAVCFNAPVVELFTATQLARDKNLRALGPDILSTKFDSAESIRRLRELNERAIGEALLHQRSLAGIGNIYKSETLFLCGTDPFRVVRDFSDIELEKIILHARKLMSANLTNLSRATRLLGGKRFWVYGRSGEACFCCGTKIKMRRQGISQRSTYWCPKCQA